MSLVLFGCPTVEPWGPGPTEVAPSDETASSSDTSSTTGTPTSTDPGPTSSTGTTETGGDPTTADPSGEPPATDTSDEPPVEECHLADDNVECDLLVERSGQVPHSSVPLHPPAGWVKAANTPVAEEDCDIYGQDCPEGQKCTALGQNWSSRGCVPLPEFPSKVGEGCSHDGTSDSCEAGSICKYSGAKGAFFCEPLCGCSEANPTCGENERCTVYNSGVLPMCERLCDPLDLGSCEAGEVCIKGDWVSDFFCMMDMSGETGVFRDECKYGNDCDPGYSCEAAPYVPGGCPEGVASCCTPLCILDDPLCPEGSICLEYFGGFGLEPAQCLEDVGYCTAEFMPLVERPALPWSI
ncbi:hypothetical protein [Nannocystis radixulma]|uniref:Uncharacterized protein n=1 Tax=Nannocystis radixulma TaxID=2995305 RepID=A0ABT5BKQ8_9BACT|nr:hypothetical protein [Nannocystis radixulma]MDC0673536.1 hypothetical protein [Nannocystis radixulma]